MLTYEEDPDLLLLEQINLGCAEAWDKLILTHRPMLIKFARIGMARLKIDWAQAWSTMMAGIVKAVSLFELAANTKFSSFLWTVLSTEVAHHRRSWYYMGYLGPQRDAFRHRLRQLTPNVPGMPEPIEAAITNETIERIHQALEVLTERECFVMNRVLEGWHVNEIAEEIGLSRQRVYSLRLAAYRKLREVLKHE